MWTGNHGVWHMTRLVFVDQEGWEHQVLLSEVNQIGRHPSRDIQVLDAMVSRQHAVISWADNGFWLQDLASKNGTFLNGERVFGPVRLIDGDVITFGDTLVSVIDDQDVRMNVPSMDVELLDDGWSSVGRDSSRDWSDGSIDASSSGFSD